MGMTDALGGVISATLGKGPVSAPDMSKLFAMIDAAGTQQKEYINALPAELQQQYAAYKAANSGATGALQTSIADSNKNLMDQTKANYDPNGAAVTAAEDAAKTKIYADVPGQQDAIREAIAASGGFGRGAASAQLAAPVLQAGQKYAQSVADITSGQLQKGQAAVQSAIEKISAVDDATANTVFGMSKEQALQILNGNRQDLKDQLSALINQSQTETNQRLGLTEQDMAQQYHHDTAQNTKDNATTNAWVNLGTNAVSSAAPSTGFLSALK